MRRHDIDNLRILAILLLFPVHTWMIWNDFGSQFYIWAGESRVLSTLIVAINPWFMPLLFALAGISARMSLKKRPVRAYIGERLAKLALPFVCGVIFIVPVQTLFARKFFFGYEGGYFENLGYFFTHLTDMSGYDGAFTPGQLWFILFLFIVSMIGLAVFRLLPYERLENKVGKMNVRLLIALFIPICFLYYIGNFGGFSLGRSFAFYMLGYYVLSNSQVMETLERKRRWVWGIFAAAQIALIAAYYKTAFYGDISVHFVAWTGTLSWLILGKRHLNRDRGFTRYFNKAAYPIYILHQSILVAFAYYMLKMVSGAFWQMSAIMLGSFGLSILCYEAIRRVPYGRAMVGIGSSKKIKEKTGT